MDLPEIDADPFADLVATLADIAELDALLARDMTPDLRPDELADLADARAAIGRGECVSICRLNELQNGELHFARNGGVADHD